MILATRFTFIVERSCKLCYHSKKALQPATYDVISGNHRNYDPVLTFIKICERTNGRRQSLAVLLNDA